jgi:hypothetical protein
METAKHFIYKDWLQIQKYYARKYPRSNRMGKEVLLRKDLTKQ